MKLAAVDEGGNPERPMVVESASLVEVNAKGTPCVACCAEVRIDAHEAIKGTSGPLRIVTVLCPMCGAKRDVYYRIVASFAN